MALETPDLDDREYAEILKDARKRIPVHSETWTDHNASDPGITFLELLSWLAETYGYQLDRVTDTHRRKYLKLLGEQPQPPVPATVALGLQPPESQQGVQIPAGTRLIADDGTGTEQPFETAEPATLVQASVECVISEGRRGRIDNSTANSTNGMHFLAFGEAAERGSAMYIGFEGDPFAAVDSLALDVTFHETELPEPATHGEAASEWHEPVAFEPSVGLSWQHCTDYANWYRGELWEELPVREDGTNQLYRGGTVVFGRPADWSSDPREILGGDRELRWIRCVVEDGGYEIPPPLDSLKLNVVTAAQRVTVEDEELRGPGNEERTTARPGQRFVFEHAPVLEATVTVGGQQWTERDDLDAAGPDDEHYVLDESLGEIRFGDGINGTVPAAGRRVVAERYVSGGGVAGNVRQSVDWRFADGGARLRNANGRFLRGNLGTVAVSAEGSAAGGADAESIDAALDRMKRDLKAPYRAVSPDDYRHVATHTPGLRFGRAAAQVERGERVEGCEPHHEVRVVVIPHSTLDAPVPSAGFLAAVQCHLERHRLLTDRVTVEAPTYVGIGVDAKVRIVPGYSVEGRRTAVADALDDFLDPLTGFEGDGWPFGRPLYRSEVYEAIETVEGVDCVLDVSVRTRNERAIDRNGNVLIDETALLSPDDHDVTVRTDSRGGKREGT